MTLIHFLLDDSFAEKLQKFVSKKELNKAISYKYHSTDYKVKVYDKVCTPFINLKLFDK